MGAAHRQTAPSAYEQGFRDGQAALRRKLAAFLDGLSAASRPTPTPANDAVPVSPSPPRARAIPNRIPKAPGTIALQDRVLAYLNERGAPLKPREIADHLATDYFGVTKACAALFAEGRAIYGWGPIENGKKGKLLSPVSVSGVTAPAPAPAPKVSLPAVVAKAPEKPRVPITTKVALAPSADDLPAQDRKDTLPKGLIARKPGQCAYPTNSPAVGRGDETTFCCAPVMGKLQYCEAHARAMWPARKAK